MSIENWSNLAKAAGNGFFAAVCLMLAGMGIMLAGMGIALVGMFMVLGSAALDMMELWKPTEFMACWGLKGIAAGAVMTLSAFLGAFFMAQIGTWALNHKNKKEV